MTSLLLSIVSLTKSASVHLYVYKKLGPPKHFIIINPFEVCVSFFKKVFPKIDLLKLWIDIINQRLLRHGQIYSLVYELHLLHLNIITISTTYMDWIENDQHKNDSLSIILCDTQLLLFSFLFFILFHFILYIPSTPPFFYNNSVQDLK